VLFLAARLHAHGPAHRLGKQRRLRRRVGGAVEIDNAHAVALEAEHPRARGLEPVDVLGRAPHRGRQTRHVVRGLDDTTLDRGY
jgi:hypothetical protein